MNLIKTDYLIAKIICYELQLISYDNEEKKKKIVCKLYCVNDKCE